MFRSTWIRIRFSRFDPVNELRYEGLDSEFSRPVLLMDDGSNRGSPVTSQLFV